MGKTNHNFRLCINKNIVLLILVEINFSLINFADQLAKINSIQTPFKNESKMAEKTRSLSGGDVDDHDFAGTSTNSIMNVSQISSYSTDSQTKTSLNITHNIGGVSKIYAGNYL